MLSGRVLALQEWRGKFQFILICWRAGKSYRFGEVDYGELLRTDLFD
jgi:hypothetical protein